MTFPDSLLHLALESADLGVWRLDLTRDQEMLRSLRHDQMFGYDTLQPSWGLERALAHILDEDRHILVQAFERAIKDGHLACEFRVRWPDGSIHWIAPRGRTDYENGEARYVTGIVSDVTARKRAEEDDLQQSKMIAIGQLTAGIAHDFNNVLQGIGGAFDLIEKKAAAGTLEGVTAVTRLGTGLVDRASRMTHRLLAFSRRSPLAPRAIALEKRLPEIAALLRPTATQHVTVTCDIEPGLCAHVDDAHLETAVLNLLVNARDASPRGGRIHLAARRASGLPSHDDAPRLVLSVSDEGTGIAADDLPHVFEPFFTTKPAGTGTGLGLSQVHGFAHQSGGHVDVESALHQGTTVRVYLPVCALPDEPIACAQVVHRPPGAARILLVDDEPGVLDTLAVTLRDQGHEVITAHHAEDAQAAWRAHAPFSALITDIGLPGPMDGCALAHWARAEIPDLPVVLITGYAGTPLDDRLPRHAEVLVKPFALSALRTLLKRWFRERADRADGVRWSG
ncbi:ATP-binding protein [Luteibacter sp. PPL201]|uniref:histidine kinase n=1 Tax=Luteibacter sahnii TaxID=3021977 RepID=A0ABT6BCA2_9GAMM